MSEDPEIGKQLERWRTGEDPPLWQGAVPDMFKLNSTIQVDAGGLWWAGATCSFCEYQATMCQEDVYFCDYHRENQ